MQEIRMGHDPESVLGDQGRHGTLTIKLFLLGIFTYLTGIGAKRTFSEWMLPVSYFCMDDPMRCVRNLWPQPLVIGHYLCQIFCSYSEL